MHSLVGQVSRRRWHPQSWGPCTHPQERHRPQVFREREAKERIRERLVAPDGLITTMRARNATRFAESEADRLKRCARHRLAP